MVWAFCSGAGAPAASRSALPGRTVCRRRHAERGAARVRAAAEEDKMDAEALREELARLRRENQRLKDGVEEDVPLTFGKHGENNRFLRLLSVGWDEYEARIMPYVGVYSGENDAACDIDVSKMQAAKRLGRYLRRGKLQVIPRVNVRQGDTFIAVPGGEALVDPNDPVAVEVSAPELGITSAAAGGEAVLVLERDLNNASAMATDGNYMWSTVEGAKVGVLANDAEVDEDACLGEAVTMVHFVHAKIPQPPA